MGSQRLILANFNWIKYIFEVHYLFIYLFIQYFIFFDFFIISHLEAYPFIMSRRLHLSLPLMKVNNFSSQERFV